MSIFQDSLSLQKNTILNAKWISNCKNDFRKDPFLSNSMIQRFSMFRYVCTHVCTCTCMYVYVLCMYHVVLACTCTTHYCTVHHQLVSCPLFKQLQDASRLGHGLMSACSTYSTQYMQSLYIHVAHTHVHAHTYIHVPCVHTCAEHVF